MSLLKLKTAPILLIEDDINKNILPLLVEIVPSDRNIITFCYEQPTTVWRSVFRSPNVHCYIDFNTDLFNKYTSTKSTVIIDSINQMALSLGWYECLKCLKRLSLDLKVEQIIIVLHKDCLSHSSKLQTHLNHLASATVSYASTNARKVWVTLKKGSKVTKTEEILTYDSSTSTLKSALVVKDDKKVDEPEKPSPGSLSTFKIEVDQIEKMEKSKLQLPYMSKINEGESKVFYEPDAVDDWDEEDPDDDLDI